MASGNPFLSQHRRVTSPAPKSNVHKSLLVEVDGSSEDWAEQTAPEQTRNAIALHLSQPRGREKPVTWVQGKLRDSQGQLPQRRSNLLLGGHRQAPTQGSGPKTVANPFGLQSTKKPWQSAHNSGLYNSGPQMAFGLHRETSSRDVSSSLDPFGLGSGSRSQQDSTSAPTQPVPSYVDTSNQLQSEDTGPGPYNTEDAPNYDPSPRQKESSPIPQTGFYSTEEAVSYTLSPRDKEASEDSGPGLYNTDPGPHDPVQSTLIRSPSAPQKVYKYGSGLPSRVSNLENQEKWGSKSVREVYMLAFEKATLPPQVTRVRYLDKHEKSSYEVTVVEGKLYYRGKLMDTTDAQCLTRHMVVQTVGTTVDPQGKSHAIEKVCWKPEVSDRYIWVMSRSGKIYAADWAAEYMQSGWEPNQHSVTGFHHSSFLGNKNVAAAGEIVVELGVLKWISNGSGHYKPSPTTLLDLFSELQERGASTDNTRVQLAVGRFGVGHEYDALAFVTARGDERMLTPLN